ncbi:MAG: molybdenum cofactor guanylyltransferase [Planctomycetes bacterium]|nr:molybdenum cofactor guanylyltransferase [Planctomycetota bacterium]
MNTVPRIGGIVLCGGRSSRMGWSKAWLPFGPERMLQRVVRILSEVVQPIVVVAAPEQELPTLPSHIMVARDPVGGRGPLEGLVAGLESLNDSVAGAYATACDIPLLRAAFVLRMIDLLGEHDAAAAEDGTFVHPLAAVYRRSVAETAVRLLAEQRLRPTHLLDAVDTRRVPAEQLRDVDPNLESLRNVNDWNDYLAALAADGRPEPDEPPS